MIAGFDIFVTRETGLREKCGRLRIDLSMPNGFVGSFRYEDAFAGENGFDLDPIGLMRNHGSRFDIAARPLSGMPMVFEDSIPDAWGKALLAKAYRMSRHQFFAPYFLMLLDDPMGALSYECRETALLFPSLKSFLSEKRSLGELGESVRKARAFEEGDTLDESLLHELVIIGSAPSGARPKFLVESDGTDWIAKPASREDRFPMIPAEAVCLDIAQACGIRIPDHRLLVVEDRPVLLIQRFDRIDTGRRHVVSMRTLLGSETLTGGSYVTMAQVLTKIGTSAEDVRMLFRQMLVNILVGNIDDHLRNFSVTFTVSEGWRLSPAYDITPAIAAAGVMLQRDHATAFHQASIATSEEIVLTGRAMGLRLSHMTEAVEQTIEAAKLAVPLMEKRGIEPVHADVFLNILSEGLRLLTLTRKIVR